MSNTELRIGDILSENARNADLRDKCALIWGDERVTYGELNERVNRLANGLLSEGVERGDRVAVLGRNSITYVALYFALAKTGAIMVPINFWYKDREIATSLDQSQARLFIYQGRFAETAGAAIRQVSSRPDTLIYDGTAQGIHALDTIAGSSAEPDATVDADDAHIILYTSGTTGSPKGATVSHRNHIFHARALSLSTGGRRDDVGVIIYPLFHTGGPDCLLLPHFVQGATLVVLDGGDPDAILTAVEDHRVTNIFCVPTVWRWILSRQTERQVDVTTVRRCLGSSDTFPTDLLDAILKTFDADVYVTYGLTEAGCILTVAQLTRDDRSKIGSVGKPMPGVELKLVDKTGKAPGPGEVGEVVARTPGVMTGYWDEPDRTAEALQDGWLNSGDLGWLDEEGYLTLSGRSKDVIISAGENIYPLEIERLIKENGKVLDVAVVGVPDLEWGESVLAVVVPVDGMKLSEREIINFVGDRVAGYKRPRYVEIVGELPVTTATGKVQKGLLRERFKKKYQRC